MTDPTPFSNPQKQRTGLTRILHAGAYSLAGLRAGWNEKAFRTEAMLAMALLPLALWLGQSWLERMFLVATMVLVLVTELLNSAVEAAIDRIGPEWHALSKNAKDMGSAAVLLSLLLCSAAFISAFYARFLDPLFA